MVGLTGSRGAVSGQVTADVSPTGFLWRPIRHRSVFAGQVLSKSDREGSFRMSPLESRVGSELSPKLWPETRMNQQVLGGAGQSARRSAGISACFTAGILVCCTFNRQTRALKSANSFGRWAYLRPAMRALAGSATA